MYTLGVVPYLNAVPLTAGLAERVRLIEAVPAHLGGLLVAGHVDAALLPVAEALRGTGDGFLGTHGIASDGPVASVLLFLRAPLEALETVVLDPASRTSACLCRWLVGEAAGRAVRFRQAARPGPRPEDEPGDGVLVIGDPALQAARRWTGAVLDLGRAWRERTGLPFVFARWTARRGLEGQDRMALALLLDDAALRGQREADGLARAWAARRGEDEEAAARYVREHVRYRIGAREEAGLSRFAQVLRAEDLALAREARHA